MPGGLKLSGGIATIDICLPIVNSDHESLASAEFPIHVRLV